MTPDNLSQLATENSGGLSFEFVPTLSVTRQHYNTLDIWHAIDEDQTPPTVKRLDQPVDILIWRKGHSPHFRSLALIEASAISAACSGDSLDAIGTKLGEDFPDVDVATEFGAMLSRWLEDQIISI